MVVVPMSGTDRKIVFSRQTSLIVTQVLGWVGVGVGVGLG